MCGVFVTSAVFTDSVRCNDQKAKPSKGVAETGKALQSRTQKYHCV